MREPVVVVVSGAILEYSTVVDGRKERDCPGSRTSTGAWRRTRQDRVVLETSQVKSSQRAREGQGAGLMRGRAGSKVEVETRTRLFSRGGKEDKRAWTWDMQRRESSENYQQGPGR